MKRIYFCVDAGGTRSRGRLYDASGAVLADAEGGAANSSVNEKQAVASTIDLWGRLAAAIGRNPGELSGVTFAIGGAGLYVRKVRDPFIAQCPRFETVLAMSDGYAALIGAGNGRPCAMLSVGTGVAGHRLFDDGTSIQRDGWGWVAGDRGSGCWMGTRALRHAIAVQDGIRPRSALSMAVMEQIGGVEGLLAGGLEDLNSKRLAAFAPLVLEKAKNGCPVAASILSRAIDYLADLIGVLHSETVPLYLCGGLGEALRPMLVDRIGRVALTAASDPMNGCFLVAKGEAPIERALFNP